MKTFIFFIFLFSFWTSQSQLTKVVIIVHQDNFHEFKTLNDVKEAWLLKSKMENKQYSIPIAKNVNSQESITFYKKALNLSTAQVKSYFTGKQYADASVYPIELNTDNEIIEYVQNNENALGFINSNSINESNIDKVKVIMMFNSARVIPFSFNGKSIVEKSEFTEPEFLKIEDAKEPQKQIDTIEKIKFTTLSRVVLLSSHDKKPLSFTYCRLISSGNEIAFDSYTSENGEITGNFKTDRKYNLELPKFKINQEVIFSSDKADHNLYIDLPEIFKENTIIPAPSPLKKDSPKKVKQNTTKPTKQASSAPPPNHKKNTEPPKQVKKSQAEAPKYPAVKNKNSKNPDEKAKYLQNVD